uniref:PGG domain-containing protein n=1 Tax=Kalanchoe fedtschenkoi TaxID=63787 RepID=A0A7N0U4K2_KALFE
MLLLLLLQVVSFAESLIRVIRSLGGGTERMAQNNQLVVRVSRNGQDASEGTNVSGGRRASQRGVDVMTAPQPPLPALYLLSMETKETYLKFGVPFYNAAIKGDWKTAKGICEVHPDIVRSRITREWETGLHIAAAARNPDFVKELVKLMTDADIALPNRINNTALCFAAASGIVKIAKEMVQRDQNLPRVRGNGGMTPLHMAALLGHRDMVHYLLPFTDVNDELTPQDLINLFISFINTNLYDVALGLLKKHPTLATARDKYKETALHVLARKPLSSKGHEDRGLWKGLINACSGIFGSEKLARNSEALNLVHELWNLVLNLDDKDISNLIREPSPLLFVATALGNVEFVKILLESYPDLIWKVDHRKRSIFHVAVWYRQESIFRIIYEIGAIKDFIALYDDSKNNNMLHMAARIAPANRLNIVSGAALQLQRELLWYKEVEKIVQPSYTDRKNADDLTPKQLFTADHKNLLKEGEEWMKNTANSCMIVSTLIATVMFSAAFTLPGGTEDNGTPNYLKKKSFLIFVVSDSLSLFSSTTSILMFLSILTSRYKEEDFVHSLPTKLTLGLLTLFLSMASMTVAFTASMFIVFNHGSSGATIPITLMACIPVTLYAVLQYSLFVDIFSSTYKSRFIFKSRGDQKMCQSLMS